MLYCIAMCFLTVYLIGALSGPLRNYILSNTAQVYERSYQPRHVRENLAKLAFGDLVDEDEELYKALQNASLSRDEGAPLYVSQKDLEGFNRRRDIRDLRAQYANAVTAESSSAPAAKRIAAKIKWVLDWLCDLKVAELRKAYFEDVDRLRSLGQSTLDVRDAAMASNPRRSHLLSTASSAEKMGQLLEIYGGTQGSHKDVSDGFFGQMLAAYLRGKPLQMPVLDTAAGPPEQPRPSCSKARCLLCNELLSSRSMLTRHVKRRHAFGKPFPCQECRRQGENVLVAEGGAAWAAHAERVHGKMYTPVLRDTVEDLANMTPCPLCGKTFLLGTALSLHLTKHHQPRGYFENLMPCVLCGEEMSGGDTWSRHIEKHNKFPMSEDTNDRPKELYGAGRNRFAGSTANVRPDALAGVKRGREQDNTDLNEAKSEKKRR